MKASDIVRKPAIVEAMAEKGDMTKVQAEAALAAFTDVVMSNVSGKGTRLRHCCRAFEAPNPRPLRRSSVKHGVEASDTQTMLSFVAAALQTRTSYVVPGN